MAEFVYHCEHCRKQHRHNRGYIFVYQVDDHLQNVNSRTQLYFCNIDCCDEWREKHEVVECEEVIELPKPNRRAAIQATRKKNAGNHLEFFQKHVNCNPERYQRCYADECWGSKRYKICKARGLPVRDHTNAEKIARRAGA